ncbi:Aste57867_13884 [Aphanomyces stellatus]|uniref:Aste57867_13884 protein n=1 Tax=Aphanomyces stellatus TaxID=120398 RepID=A0A485KZ88_9STRA|nr:hypothetical protein As57867_013833 [Aphanomyces stellatus]VFT90715.1 Aste57867_13884 [Aphanomyces stellatus]
MVPMQQGHIAAYHTESGAEIRVKQDTRRVDGMGGEVWPGAHVLCAHVESYAVELNLQDARVLELGAGCGLCGLVSAALGAPTVVLSDEYPDLLQLNIDLNKTQPWMQHPIAVRELEWGDRSHVPDGDVFDVILGSEITQVGRTSHRPLLQTIAWVCHDKSIALLSMDACDAACEGTCEPSKCTASHFCSFARDMGFSVTKHKSVQLTSLASVTRCVGALGRPWPLDGTELSAVFELRKLKLDN